MPNLKSHRALAAETAALTFSALALAAAAGVAGIAAARALKPSQARTDGDLNRRTSLAQLDGTPGRRYYTGHNLKRAISIEDLRAMTHKRLPRFSLEYLEGGAEDEETMARERQALAEWRFVPRTLVDVSQRSLRTKILGQHAPMPLVVSPTGLNGVFRDRADSELAQGALAAGVPFVQSTMSQDLMTDVARAAPGVRHWWQLYVFGGDEVWQEILKRADQAGCEALVITTNTQIFGNREWQTRSQATPSRLSVPSAIDAALHPGWFATTLNRGMPVFRNVVDLVPKDKRSFFACADWIRQHQPTSLSWDTIAKIRQRWTKPLILKGILSLDDVRLALDSGVDGIVLDAHGGRQLDWTITALDILPQAREFVGDRMALYMSGGIRRGTDMLKAIALGADAVWAGRAPLYGLCAAGAPGVAHALDILKREATDAMGLLGVSSVGELGAGYLCNVRDLGRLNATPATLTPAPTKPGNRALAKTRSYEAEKPISPPSLG